LHIINEGLVNRTWNVVTSYGLLPEILLCMVWTWAFNTFVYVES